MFLQLCLYVELFKKLHQSKCRYLADSKLALDRSVFVKKYTIKHFSYRSYKITNAYTIH